MVQGNIFASPKNDLEFSIQENNFKDGKYSQNLTGILKASLTKNGFDNFDQIASNTR